MQLHEWQQCFQQIVLSGQDNAALPLCDGSIARQQQLSIYASAYQLRLAEALRTNYAMLHQLLGDDDFDFMAKKYLLAYPPASPSIRWFGDKLSAFLEVAKPFNTVQAIAELARFEWSLRHAIDAADGQLLTEVELASTAPEEWGHLKLALHPSLTLLELNWNTPQIWRALNENTTHPDPVATPCAWLVYRQPDLATHWRSAEQCEVSCLRIWNEGGSFDDVCQRLMQQAKPDQSAQALAMQAAVYLKTWVQQGLLIHPK